MKLINKLFLILVCSLYMNSAGANSDKTFVPPSLSIVDAVKLARDQCEKIDYIVLSAVYMKSMEKPEIWFWKVELVHPKKTDRIIAYSVDKNRKVYLLYKTE